MNNKFLLSIIIANYNNEQYLNECIDNILKQTYKNIEIVIIDDASTDGSSIILDQYSARYAFVKVIYNKVNQGVRKSRDYAIRSASGMYITTIDSDDYYLDNKKLELEMEIIKNFHKQGKHNVIAFSNIVLVNEQGKKLLPKAKNKIEEGRVLIQLFARSCMVPRDFIFSKKQYEEAGCYDFNIPIYEDWDLKLRLAKNNDFFYTGIDGIAYRKHGMGLSDTGAEKHVQWLKYIYEKNIKLVEPAKREYVTQQFNNCIKNNFNYGLLKKLRIKAKKYLHEKYKKHVRLY